MLIEFAALHEFFLREITTEIEADFPQLRLIPDTQVIRTLDYLTDQSAQERTALILALARRAAWVLCQEERSRGERKLPAVQEADNPYYDGDLDYLRYCDACLSTPARGGLRYTPIRLLKGIQEDEHIGGLEGWLERMHFSSEMLQPVPELLPDWRLIQPASARALLKQVETVFEAHFSASGRKIAPEFYRFEGSLGDTQLRIHLDFNQRVDQLRYRVQLTHAPTRMVVDNLNLEYLWGVGWGGWNYLTEANAPGAIELLANLISGLASLPQRLFENSPIA